MSSFESVDFFTDASIVPDPYPYYEHLRDNGPVVRLAHHNVVAVTGYEEAAAVYKDTDTFSNCVAIGGPFPPLPFEPRGDDITSQIEAHRHQFPMSEHMTTMDPPNHHRARSLLSRLLTPRRLKENEEFMWRLADRQIDEFFDNGECEFITAYAKPFSAMVIADLLGVPEEDHPEFREMLDTDRPSAPVAGSLDHDANVAAPLDGRLDDKFRTYLQERRREPRNDVLTALATAKYPDGSTPEIFDVATTATLVFAAGQETTAKLLGSALQTLADRPDLQQSLRQDPSPAPVFIEESLRTESSLKSNFRLVRKPTTLGGIDIPAGTIVMVLVGGVNRDPDRFDDPHVFEPGRRNVREHIAFGRGPHSCPGAPLARAEGRITIERMLVRTSDIKINESKHGPAGDRRYSYEPTYQMRGLTELHLAFTAAR